MIACARRINLLNELASSNNNIIPYQLDISNKEEIINFKNYIADKKISILVNCAGGGGGPYFNDILQEEPEYLENAFKTNASSTFNLTKNVVPSLINSDNPIVVNITSVSGHEVFRASSAYTIAKHSESILTKILRRDLSNLGIKVTELIPSSVNSHKDPLQQNSISPEDIADIVYFICSLDKSININSISVGHIKELPFLS